MAPSTCQENLVTNVFALLPYTLVSIMLLLGHLFLTADEIPADGSMGSGGVPVVAEQSSAPP